MAGFEGLPDDSNLTSIEFRMGSTTGVEGGLDRPAVGLR